MDFCLTRIHSKFYIAQILNSMKYIEYNNINYFIQEDCKEIDIGLSENLVDLTDVPKKNPIDSIIKGDINIYSNKNNFDIDQEEEKLILEEIEKDLQYNDDFFIIPSKNNEKNININIKKNDKEDKTIMEINEKEINNNKTNVIDLPNNKNKQESNLTENNFKKENKLKKNFQLIESNNDNELKYKKVFVFNDRAFSKVEIQGIIIDKKSYGHDDKNTRLRIIVDDSTGNIEVFAWKGKRENVFHKLRDEVVK